MLTSTAKGLNVSIDFSHSQLPSALFSRSLDVLVYHFSCQFGVEVFIFLYDIFPDYMTLSVLS